jgi:predicted acetyltransferase
MAIAKEPKVSLDVATSADSALLGNLLELYAHELSDVFPDLVLGPDGRFGYPQLPLYWSESGRRFAFVIRADGQVAGFVLVTRGSPATEDPEVFDVSEFFVLRRYRRVGVGRWAAQLLWHRLPGRWTVRVAEGNGGGRSFWASLLALAAAGRETVSAHAGEHTSWWVYAFDSAALLEDAPPSGLRRAAEDG